MQMDQTEFHDLFTNALQRNNLEPLAAEQIHSFYRFTEHLLTVNEHTNLTAIRDIPSIIDKHYVDSLLISRFLPIGARVLDLGCGPGFPSIPLAIARPDLTIVALDSTAKKIAFVQESAQLLQINNLGAVSGRAEDGAIRKQLKTFDFVVSRAVARLNILCELCLPYLKVGGSLLALKGARFQEEADEAKHAIKILGGDTTGIDNTSLVTQDGEEIRATIMVKLLKTPPPQYPRAYAAILKKPL